MKIACYINHLSTAFRGSSFLDWTGNLVGSVLSMWHRHIISTHHLFSKKSISAVYRLFLLYVCFFYPVISLYSCKKFHFSLLLACSFLVRWEPKTLFHNIISVLQTFYAIVILVFQHFVFKVPVYYATNTTKLVAFFRFKRLVG